MPGWQYRRSGRPRPTGAAARWGLYAEFGWRRLEEISGGYYEPQRGVELLRACDLFPRSTGPSSACWPSPSERMNFAAGQGGVPPWPDPGDDMYVIFGTAVPTLLRQGWRPVFAPSPKLQKTASSAKIAILWRCAAHRPPQAPLRSRQHAQESPRIFFYRPGPPPSSRRCCRGHARTLAHRPGGHQPKLRAANSKQAGLNFLHESGSQPSSARIRRRSGGICLNFFLNRPSMPLAPDRSSSGTGATEPTYDPPARSSCPAADNLLVERKVGGPTPSASRPTTVCFRARPPKVDSAGGRQARRQRGAIHTEPFARRSASHHDNGKWPGYRRFDALAASGPPVTCSANPAARRRALATACPNRRRAGRAVFFCIGFE